jgi:hypothetical protein
MSRLTEREPHWLGEEFWVSAQEPDEEELDEVYMKLKYYEDLEEQGRLITLPCKVGDTVYHIAGRKIYESELYTIEIAEGCISAYDYDAIWLGTFGGIVFTTKEEAEAKLKELQGE